jgi:site-specific recombinase XerD
MHGAINERRPRREPREIDYANPHSQHSGGLVMESGGGPRPAASAGPVERYLGDLSSPASRRTMRQALDLVARHLSDGELDAAAFPWHTLDHPDTAAARAHVAERYAPTTARKVVAALRGVLKRCWRLGQMSTDSYFRAVDLEPIRGSRLPPGRAISRAELRALLEVCADDLTPRGARDAAMVAVLYGAGLRRQEAAALELAAVNLDERVVEVTGKGNRQRRVPLPAGAAEILAGWIQRRGPAPGALFLAVNRAGALVGHPLTGQAVYQMIVRRARAAGVAYLSPHDLRRSFVSDLLDAGADLAVVQRMVGHSEVKTTARYDRRGDKATRGAAELIHIPVRVSDRRAEVVTDA